MQGGTPIVALVTLCFGFEVRVALDFNETGDAFLICSDGLVEGLWNSGMQRLIRNPSKDAPIGIAERLVSEAVQTDGKDNTTALVFEMT